MSQIKVGPIHYKVETVEDLRGEEGEELHGHVEDKTRTIRLNAQATDEGRYVTTWHEIIHTFDFLYGLLLSEQEISILAAGITQILQDNPQLNWTEYAKKTEEL